MSNQEDISPIRKQYLQIKRQYPDAILFFRLGDFYETFDNDAETTARELDIVLTSRSVAKGIRIPMAGIPYHAVENYLARLIDKGYHVAICEQVGDEPAKGIFQREVVRVVTPGTVTEPGLLPGDANNYLAAVLVEDGRAGIGYVDITTGEFAATELNGEDILALVRAELERLSPAEILLQEGQPAIEGLPGYQTLLPPRNFEPSRCQTELLGHFKASTLEGFGLKGSPLAVRAAGVILQYLYATQKSSLDLLTRLSTYSLNDFMVLDAATRRNLEITETIRGGNEKGSLLDVLDRTVTPMGKRQMRQWVSKPLLDLNRIQTRQAGVNAFFEEGILRAELRARLKHLADIERLATRIQSGSAQPRDLAALRGALVRLPPILEMIPQGGPLAVVLKFFSTCDEELSLLENALADEPPATLQNVGVIRPGFSAELDGVVERSRHAREWIADLESVERDRTGIRSLKVGYNKVFGYYIEISRASANLAPQEYIRKQTLVNAERYITPEMKEYETLVLNAEERIHEIEVRLFKDVCTTLARSAPKLLATARALAALDCLAALAEAAAFGGYVCPTVLEEDVLEIRAGRHPVVELNLPGGERFVPNDAMFKPQERIWIITGPNMSGKSTFLRQVALIVLMAQVGSFVPAESARIALVDRIFTRIGAQDEIAAGHSTFFVEMLETANILHHATRRSLVVLDEIGRGTSTYDGVSIAWAVVEYLHNHPQLRPRTLFATHYHELTQMAEILPGVSNYNVAVSEADGRVVFLHTIIPGGADRSYGIHVGQLAGLPGPVVQRAQEILRQLESSSGKAVRMHPQPALQLALFPETNPLLQELDGIDLNVLSPIEALTKLYEWQRRFGKKG
jgi:DNA mismatch repair protein MutS